MSASAIPPTKLGEHRVVVLYTVADTQVSIESTVADLDEADRIARRFAATCHDLMVLHNERIVLPYRQKLDELEGKIAAAAQELAIVETAVVEDEARLNGHEESAASATPTASHEVDLLDD